MPNLFGVNESVSPATALASSTFCV